MLVGIRGDRRESLIADFEVVQADDRRRFFIPYWPQPGLMPRDSARGHRVKSIAYKGFDNNLHEYFFSDEWAEWVASKGLNWLQHSTEHAPTEVSGVRVDWHDYRDVDVVLAFRPAPRRFHERHGFTTKPASKLCNAWHAEVPAILGLEYAYREIRRSDLDYIEISSPEEVKSAVERLRSNPELYRRMVENARLRAPEFSVQSIRKRWEELLFDRIPRLTSGPRFRRTRRLPIGLRVLSRRAARLTAGRRAH